MEDTENFAGADDRRDYVAFVLNQKLKMPF